MEKTMLSFEIDRELRGTKLPRTIRFPEVLFEKLSAAAQQNNVSFNRFVLQCCRFALDHMKDIGLK
ncbi:YlcI/YnfO family protein [Christensenellaceae bacterium 44-20]